MLSLEIGELGEAGFDLSLTGFDEFELGELFAERTQGRTDPWIPGPSRALGLRDYAPSVMYDTGKIMGGNPVFRGTRVPVRMLAELVPSRACARMRTGGEVCR